MTSRNSSKPPSSDGLTKPAPKSLRGKSKRGPGRPKGQMGFTLWPVDDPDHRVEHESRACWGCGAGLGGAAWAGVEARQVFDLPPLRLEVTEQRLISRACPCGVITKADARQGVSAIRSTGSSQGKTPNQIELRSRMVAPQRPSGGLTRQVEPDGDLRHDPIV